MATTINNASRPSRARMVKAAMKLDVADAWSASTCSACSKSPSTVFTRSRMAPTCSPAAMEPRSSTIAPSIRTISAWSRADSSASTGSKPSR